MSRSAILEHLRELNLTGMLAGYKELLDRPGPVTVAVPMVGAPGTTASTVNERVTWVAAR